MELKQKENREGEGEGGVGESRQTDGKRKVGEAAA